jgi:AAA+ superfamily predicted ATPase
VRWPRLAKEAEGLSHADLVKSAEMAAKQAVMRGAERVGAGDLGSALQARQATRVG